MKSLSSFIFLLVPSTLRKIFHSYHNTSVDSFNTYTPFHSALLTQYNENCSILYRELQNECCLNTFLTNCNSLFLIFTLN